MLRFHCLDDADALDAIRRNGLPASSTEDVRLHSSLADAQEKATGPILVIDPTALSPAANNAPPDRVSAVPRSAICNLDPYRPPTAVRAGGGYVACPLPTDVALLLIHRRGVWDLPKGKQDPGEDIKTCARREVQEEVGITDLQVIGALGTTQHGYPDGDTYAVKTTYWYLMQTPERSFEPERQEGIRRVAWARWAVARRHIGYDTLRRHMDRVESDVRRTASNTAPSEQ